MTKLTITTAQLQSMRAENRTAIHKLQIHRANVEREIVMGKAFNKIIPGIFNKELYKARAFLTDIHNNLSNIQLIIKNALKYGTLTRSDAQRLEKHQTVLLGGVQNDMVAVRAERARFTTDGKRIYARYHRQVEIQRAIRKQLASM